MPRRVLALTLFISFATISLAACGGGGSRTGSTVSAEGAPPETNIQKLAAQTDDFGYITKDAALQLFALLYGPLPGVTPPPGGPGIEADGSLAISGVFRNWDVLSEEQRTAIRSALGLGPTFTPPPGVFGKMRPSAPPLPGTFNPEIAQVLGLLEAHLGKLSVPVNVQATPPPFPGSKALADALIYDAGKGTACNVRLFPSGYGAKNVLISTLAHEFIHCYQQDWGKRPPGWIEEGMAEWAGATIAAEAGVPFDPTDQKWLTAYTATPQTTLFARSYDAMGWFAYLAQSGVDLWSGLQSISTAPYNAAAYGAATAGVSGAFVEGWGPAQLDYPTWAGRWEITGPGIPPSGDAPKFKNQSVGNGAKVDITATNFAAARKAMTFDADVTLITLAGSTAGLDRVKGSADRPLASYVGFQCTRPDGNCECPAGTEQAGEKFPSLEPGPHFFALSGGAEPAAATVYGFTLNDACNARSCLIGTWTNTETPAIASLPGLQGGTGSVLTIDPAGNVTLDYAGMTPFRGDITDGSFELTVRGAITAKIAIPPGVEVNAPVPFSNAVLTGVTGSGSINVGGFGAPIEESFVQGILALGNGGSGTNFSRCSDDTLALSSGSGTWTYQRVSS